jgi:hypothetical protein
MAFSSLKIDDFSLYFPRTTLFPPDNIADAFMLMVETGAFERVPGPDAQPRCTAS